MTTESLESITAAMATTAVETTKGLENTSQVAFFTTENIVDTTIISDDMSTTDHASESVTVENSTFDSTIFPNATNVAGDTTLGDVETIGMSTVDMATTDAPTSGMITTTTDFTVENLTTAPPALTTGATNLTTAENLTTAPIDATTDLTTTTRMNFTTTSEIEFPKVTFSDASPTPAVVTSQTSTISPTIAAPIETTSKTADTVTTEKISDYNETLLSTDTPSKTTMEVTENGTALIETTLSDTTGTALPTAATTTPITDSSLK